jgi:pimeloyl-ACP methyl ester carboxylesterase
VAVLALAAAGAASAQVEQVVTVQRGGYSISALAMHRDRAGVFRHGIALFPGHPGIMKIEPAADGEPRFTLKGNFLIRARRFWVDDETVVLSVDAPSDQWANFPQYFRSTARYGEDIAALLGAAAERFGVQEWTFVGTSEGSISAFHASHMNPKLARRLILTSSLFEASRNGPGLGVPDARDLPPLTLWVHHVDDGCRYTPYSMAQRAAQRTAKPLISVHGGGPGKGDPCQAFRAHGYVGIERETVEAMRQWVKTGDVPREVRRH